MKYGVSYFGSRILKHVEEDMKELKEIGFDVIVHTFSENDHKFYFRTMKDIVKLTRDLGMEVWIDPWGVGGVFGGEAFSNFLIENPSEWQITNRGRAVGSACFNSPKFREYMKRWLEAAVETGADAVFWDEPHFHILKDFPKEWTCRCERCKEKFKETYGHDMPEEFTEEVSNFRNKTIKDFFEEVLSYSKKLGMKNVICFLPFESELFGLKDYESIAKIEYVDNIGSDPYWMAFKLEMNPFLKETTQKILKLSSKYGKENHMWLQAFKVPRGREEDIVKGAKILKKENVETVLFWGVFACKHISSIAPDDPEKAWEVVKQIVKEVR
ncbi:MAG: hypothetical protein DRP24_00110 [Thermotoga sp.]|nr:MAG: hypothetical protein DRP24_00110 [Thermotoga sp.]